MKTHLLILAGLLISSTLQGSGIMGGHFEWDCLGKDSFLVTLTLYEDCNKSGGPYSPLKVQSAKCGTRTYNWTKGKTDDVTSVCKGQETRCSSPSSSFKYGIHKTQFTTIISLANWRAQSCCEVTLSVLNHDRAPSRATDNKEEDFYLSALLNTCISPCANSPKLGRDPDFIVPLGRDYSIDRQFSSPAGDSLVYSCFEPHTSATRQTNWSRYAGCSYNGCSPLYVNSTWPKTRKNFHIDSASGAISFRALSEEHTVLTLKIEQYRNGKLIAVVHSESNVIIIKSPSNNTPTISGINNSLPIAENFRYSACVNSPVCFKIAVSDADKKDSVGLGYTNRVPGASIKTIKTNPKRDTLEFCWTPDTSHKGKTYSFWVNANDSFCPLPGRNTREFTVSVGGASSSLDLSYSTKEQACAQYNFSVKEKNKTYHNPIVWKLNDTTILSRSYAFSHTFKKTGIYPIKAEVQHCGSRFFMDTLVVNYVFELEAKGINDTILCDHINLLVAPTVTGNNGPVKYSWTYDPALYPLSKNSSAEFILPKRAGVQHYGLSLALTDSAGCRLKDSMLITTKGNSKMVLMNDALVCTTSDEAVPLKTHKNHAGWYGSEYVKNDTLFLNSSNYGKHKLDYLHVEDSACIISDMTFEHYPTPKLNLAQDFTRCEYADLTSLAASPAGGVWKGTGILKNSFSPGTAGLGKHKLVYLFTDTHGCRNQDSLFAKVVNYRPSIKVSDSVSTCGNDSLVHVSATPKGGTWNGVGQISKSQSISYDPRTLSPGSYQLTYELLDSNECFNAENTVLTVNEAPKAAFTLLDSSYLTGQKLKVTNTSTVVNPTQFVWSLGNPPFKTVSGSQPNLVFDSVGIFSLTLVAKDLRTGCADGLGFSNIISVQLGTGIVRYSDKVSTRIFPNPSNSWIHIAEEFKWINIYNVKGLLILKTLNDKGPVDISALPKGDYLVELRSENAISLQKLQVLP